MRYSDGTLTLFQGIFKLIISVSGLVDDREHSLIIIIIIIIINNLLILLFTNINKVAMDTSNRPVKKCQNQCKVDQKIPMTIFVTGPSLTLPSVHF